jgi:hypothetical protein
MRSKLGIQKHIRAIDELARQADAPERIEIARELIGLATEVLAYTTPPQPKPDDVNLFPAEAPQAPPDYARLSRAAAASMKRKAAMLRMCLQGESVKAIAKAHDISPQAVLGHLTVVIGTLKKRTRTAHRFRGGPDPLAELHFTPLALTPEERTVYLKALGRFERELERRERGMKWADIWE